MTKKRPVQVKADVPSKNSPMPKKQEQAIRDLRRRAEKKARISESKTGETPSPAAARQLFHELRVHQIELEMQNEELRRAQEALEASQARYFDLYDLAPIGYCILDHKGLIQEANLTAATRLGVDRGVLIKQPITRFILPEDQDIYYLHRKQLFETGAPQSCEFRMLRANAAPFWARVEITTAQAADGASACRVVMSDITERKRAEILLQESSARYEAIFEATGTATMLVEEDATIITANGECLSVTGYRPEELLGTKWPNYVAPESLEIMLKYHHLRREEPGKVPHKYEVKLVNKKGEIRDAVLDIAMIPGTKRSVVSMLDVTERKRAEEALRISEEKYRLLVENAAEAILVAQDGMLKFVNHMASEIIGYSKEELLSSPFLEFIHPDDRNMVGERYLRRLAGDVSQSRYEFRLVARDGSIKWVELNAIQVDWEGRPAVLNFLSDITERKKTEEALLQTEQNFRRSMDESPLGIRVVSVEGETLYANRAILDIYGYDDIEELRSTPVKKRYTPASYAEYQIRKKMRMSGKDCPSEYETSIVRKTGEIRCLQVLRKEILWNGQKQFQSIYRDITETKKLEEKLRESLSSLQKAFSGTIQVVSTISEKRDPYTAGHQARVADLTRAIAQDMGLPPERVESLRLAGTIHDIGKVSVPAEILSKPARLTKIEFDMVKSHSQVGYDILQDIEFAWPIAEMVLEHHERMNGSGYPKGLKGENILLEARILAVADVVEAMASHRPYRPALGIGAALEEIEKNRGILYDSGVVSSCLKLFREKGYNFK